MNEPIVSRILVCGDRYFRDYALMKATLDDYYKSLDPQPDERFIMHGGCGGADLLSEEYATKNVIHTARMNALWDVYGNPAGPIRNRAMLKCMRPDIVIAFHGNKGTKDMIQAATDLGVPVKHIKE